MFNEIFDPDVSVGEDGQSHKRFWIDENFGNDLNIGSLNRPFKTIEHARVIACNGDIVVIIKSGVVIK